MVCMYYGRPHGVLGYADEVLHGGKTLANERAKPVVTVSQIFRQSLHNENWMRNYLSTIV